MKCWRATVGTSLVLATMISWSDPAKSQEHAIEQRYSIKQDAPDTGSAIRKDRVWGGRLPYNKRWNELSAEQQREFKDQYVAMKDLGDEPPFPAGGLGSLYKKVADANDRIHSSGLLELEVRVDASGKGTAVSVYKSPDPDMTRAAAGILMFEKYKPALCDGQPCAMPFPFRIKLMGPGAPGASDR